METKTKKILDIFEQINRVPRCSKNEDAIAAWLVAWAKEHSFEVKTDAVKNILIKVPATKGCENAPIIVLQGHMDMVCEKTPDSTHDFKKDPIKHIIEGEWLHADKTTLGADNGIALALALALATDSEIKRPALELLFTVDEETGLTGANALSEGFVAGKVLLNIDSEDEGVFTVGCAGGRDSKISLPLSFENFQSGFAGLTLSVGGLQGGHSGVDIKEPKANANILLARIVKEISNMADFRIVDLKGGSAHNAIPRDASASIAVDSSKVELVKKICNEFGEILKKEYSFEKNLVVTLKNADNPDKVFTKSSTAETLNLMLALPHGVAEMSRDIAGLVETSSNFATIKVEDGKFKVLTSQRSSVMSRLTWMTDKIESVAKLCNAEVVSGSGYPSWQPDMDSALLKKCLLTYKNMFGKEPVVEIIHAGLECGIIGSKYSGMDMISYGPTIKNPHSPDEKMFLPSLPKIWDFTVELLKSFC